MGPGGKGRGRRTWWWGRGRRRYVEVCEGVRTGEGEGGFSKWGDVVGTVFERGRRTLGVGGRG